MVVIVVMRIIKIQGGKDDKKTMDTDTVRVLHM